jgi:hypothetical protein
MAYNGSIDYFGLPFRDEQVQWLTEEINSFSPAPWRPFEGAAPFLEVLVRDFSVSERPTDDCELIYDTHDEYADRFRYTEQRRECVVVARLRADLAITDALHYVLLVASTDGDMSVTDGRIYRRVGAGKMLGKFISFDGPGIEARIY